MGQLESPMPALKLPGLETDEEKLQELITAQRQVLGLFTHMANVHDEWPLRGIPDKQLEAASERRMNCVIDGDWNIVHKFFPLQRILPYTRTCVRCHDHVTEHMEFRP